MPQMPEHEPTRVDQSSYVSIGLFVGAIALVVSIAVTLVGGAYALGQARKDVLDEAGAMFLRKDVAEAQLAAGATTTASELRAIREALGEVRALTGRIPSLEAKLQLLESRSRDDK